MDGILSLPSKHHSLVSASQHQAAIDPRRSEVQIFVFAAPANIKSDETQEPRLGVNWSWRENCWRGAYVAEPRNKLYQAVWHTFIEREFLNE